MEKYGYRFIETERPGLGLLRFSLDSGGKVIKKPVTEPISRYAVRETREPLSWNVLKVQKVIFDEQTQEQLATWTTFYYAGNWLQKKWYVAAYDPCGVGSGRDFFVKVLKPSH